MTPSLFRMFSEPKKSRPEQIPSKFMAADFVAIDFETATAKRNSACSIGLAAGTAGRIEGTYTQLLRPPGNEYLPGNISIHGIHPHQTVSAPTIADLYHHGLADLIEARVPLVAHNASFDMSVLRESLDHHGITTDWITAHCTVDFARVMYPTLKNHRLDTVARHIGYPLIHHDPVSDAMAAAEIMFRWLDGPGASLAQERNLARLKPYLTEQNEQFKALLIQAKGLEAIDPKEAARTYMYCINKMRAFDRHCIEHGAPPDRPRMPINRITLVMERAGLVNGCLEAFQWYSSYEDPVGMTATDSDAIEKRMARIERSGQGKQN